MIRTEGRSAAPPRNLSALAWVLGDLSQSLPLATLSLHRAARDSKPTDDLETGTQDEGNLRTASQQIRQAAGALNIIGYTEVAAVLSAAEAASAYFLHTPGSCTVASVAQVSRACIAVLNFLQAKMGGYLGSPVALYPCYRDVKKIYSTQHCHPADLWPYSGHLHTPAPWALEPASPRRPLASDAGARFDQALLGCLRKGDSASAEAAAQLCGDLAGTHDDPLQAGYWYAAAGFFDAIRLGMLLLTPEVKRSMTDIRTQFLARNAPASVALERLTRELVFFCACAQAQQDAKAPWLAAVRRAYGVEQSLDLDYTTDFFSRRDPQHLALARRRHETLAESWNAFANGQNSRLQQVHEQFAVLRDQLIALEPKAEELLHTLAGYLDTLQQTGEAPSAAMAMEVAFALLALEAACEIVLPAPKMIAQQFAELIKRLATARATHRHAPLADWMAHTLRRSIASGAMNKLIRALHTEFRQIELDIEHYFGAPREIVSLSDACIRLVQAGGIFSLLDLPHAHQTTVHLHGQITAEMMQPSTLGNTRTEAPASWATNLGNLGVLTDMLAYQLGLAQKAFRFDPEKGELIFQTIADGPPPQAGDTAAQTLLNPAQPVQGKPMALPPSLPADPDPNQAQAQPGPAASVGGGRDVQTLASADDEILGLFLEEARGIVVQARQAIVQTADADNEQTRQHNLHAIRRAFHTLKGGAKMVGLQALGESAWAFEQLMNEHLSQPRNPLAQVLAAAEAALTKLLDWVNAISQHAPVPYQETEFRNTADALRLGRVASGLLHEPVVHVAQAKPAVAPAGLPDPEDTIKPEPAPHTQALLQVFAAEAAERIQSMHTELQRWSALAETIRSHAPYSHAIRDLAHALRGGAATVGCTGLERLAHTLESCMESLAPDAVLTKARQLLLQDCVAELGRLLQGFTGGHLFAPHAHLISALQVFEAIASNAVQTTTAPGAPTGPRPQAPPTEAEVETDADVLDAALWPVFQEEARELLQALGASLDAWASHIDKPGAVDPVRRLLHTLKGSARLAGAMRLGALTHDLESYLTDLPDGQATAAHIATAREALDAMQVLFDQYRPITVVVEPHLQEATAPEPSVQTVQALQPMLRIRAAELDHVLDQSSEVLLIRSRMQARTEDLLVAVETMVQNATRLREQLRELELQSELQMQSRSSPLHSGDAGLDPLELDRFTRLQEITRMMAESHDDLGTVQKVLRTGLTELDRDLALQNRQAREMHQDILAMRLVAFDDIAGRLYAVLRQAARHYGVAVRLDISGSSTRLDRSLLHRITPCLEHMLRNAVAHGIEAASDRVAAGKAANGFIGISVGQSGQELRIDVWDDGAGLRTERIRAKAVEKSLWPADAPFGDGDALALLLKPGFSTADDVTLVAGRGIGMDVVHSEVQALGGHLAIHTEAGKGMRFSMVFPLSTGLTQVAVFRVGDRTFGVPSAMVVPNAALQPAMAPVSVEGRRFLELPDHGQVELFWAGDLLEGPEPPAGPARDSLPIVVFSSTGRTVAVQVDQALGEREMTLKSLGPQLSGLPALIGAGLLPSAELVLIYNPVALATVYGKAARSRQAARAARAHAGDPGSGGHDPHEAPVLVVDDSITMRRVTERLLVREGIPVLLASDGLDALDKLKTIRPAVVVSDIEMPRLDGFDLVRRIRADPRTAEIPIIIISSRVAQKHQDIAAQLGANHYLGKPFHEAELLSLVRLYCGEKSPA